MSHRRAFKVADHLQPNDGEPIRSVVQATDHAAIVAWTVKSRQRITPHVHPPGQDTWTVFRRWTRSRRWYQNGADCCHPSHPIQAMLKLYYSLAPNPMKVALFLEESGLPYEAVPVDTRKGEQHAAAFTALNPNAKVPVIVDGETTVFDSNAILLYLAEKTGQFLPAAADRGAMLSWLMFVASGIGPFTGQCVHFKHYAPEPNPYATNRYDFEAWRHWKILDARLADRPWMVGDSYSLLDMAVWGWARAVPFALGAEAWSQLPHLKRLFDAVNERPAAQRAAALKDRYAFKTELDDEARRAMFPQNERLKG